MVSPDPEKNIHAGPSARDPPRRHGASGPAYVRTEELTSEIRVRAPPRGPGASRATWGWPPQTAPREAGAGHSGALGAGAATMPRLRHWGLCIPLLDARTARAPVGVQCHRCPRGGRGCGCRPGSRAPSVAAEGDQRSGLTATRPIRCLVTICAPLLTRAPRRQGGGLQGQLPPAMRHP